MFIRQPAAFSVHDTGDFSLQGSEKQESRYSRREAWGGNTRAGRGKVGVRSSKQRLAAVFLGCHVQVTENRGLPGTLATDSQV